MFKYSTIMSMLYRNDINSIISVLQKSITPLQLKIAKDKIVVIHTGFTFFTQKNTEMEILIAFRLDSNDISIIRQPKATWDYRKIPTLNGLILERTKEYFDTVPEDAMVAFIRETDDDHELSKLFIKSVAYDDNNRITHVVLENDNQTIKSIKVEGKKSRLLGLEFLRKTANTTENHQTVEYPIQTFEFPLINTRRFTVFFDGINFSRLNSVEVDDFDDDPPSTKLDFYTWLREEFGDDSDTAYWNME